MRDDEIKELNANRFLILFNKYFREISLVYN